MSQKTAVENAQELLSKAESAEDPWLLSYADLVTNLLAFMVLLVSIAGFSFKAFEQIPEAFSPQTGKKTLLGLSSEIAALAHEQGVGRDLHVLVDREGLAIQLQDAVLFPSGVATLSEEGARLVARIAPILGGMDDKYRFIIEGHTDDVPISTPRFKSNWDLSAARALEVRRRLAEAGLRDERLSIAAYADTRPDAALGGDTQSVEEIRRRNRRVVIRVYF